MMSRLAFNALLLARQIGKHQLQARSIARWVAPTLRELRRRDRLMGEKQPQPRSGFTDWNYRAELFAFGKRLNEEFQLPLLQQAFTLRSYVQKEQSRQKELGIDVETMSIADNTDLAQIGEHITKEYVNAYVENALPTLPQEGRKVICDYLLSIPTLAHISSQLGTKELIFAAEYPPNDETLAKTFLAIVGALQQSTSEERAFLFVRDFVCTQLSQRDLFEIWEISNPEDLLQQICEQRKLGTPEPRLLGDCGKNTVLAAYQVGIFCNKKMISEGFGENVETAITTASLTALQNLFGIGDSMRPFNFQLQVKPKASRIAEK